MSQTPFMQLYIGDYLADTRHLSTEQHGAYLLLLMALWRAGGSLPNEPSKLARVVAAQPRRWAAIWDGIAEFFVVEDGRISNPRLTRELEKANEKSRVRATSGAQGGKAKALKRKEADLANATRLPKHSSEPEPEIEDEGKPSSKRAPATRQPAKSRIPADWRASEVGRAYARDQGLSEPQIDELEQEFVVYWTDRTRDASKSAQGWEMTWRNRVRDVASRLPRKPPPPPDGQRSKSNDRLSAWLDAAERPRGSEVARGPDRDPPQALLRGR